MNRGYFKYPDFDDPVLVQLKRQSGIDVSDCTRDLNKVRLICGYVHTLFEHDGDNQPSSFDATTVLTEAQSGSSFRCVEYSFLAVWLLLAHGIYARVIGLKSREVETLTYGAAHVVIEYWDDEATKWIMCDVQAGLMLIDDNQDYMSAHDLFGLIEKGEEPQYMPTDLSRTGCDGIFGDDQKSYFEWVKEYVYFIDTFEELKLGYPTGLAPERIMMLVPKDSDNPIMFQDMFAMNALYSTDPSLLYSPPKSI